MLKERGLATGLGDEGGFAPSLDSNRAALDLIAEAVDKAGLKLGTDIVLALDVAATEFFDEGKGVYTFEGVEKSADEMAAYYTELASAYPIVSIEDPMSEEDWAGWNGADRGHRRQGADRRRRPVRDQRRAAAARASTRSRPTLCWSRSTRSAASPRRSTPSTSPTAAGSAA